MPFDDVKIPISPVAWAIDEKNKLAALAVTRQEAEAYVTKTFQQYRSECLIRPLVYGDKPSGVVPATNTATSVWLATYGSGMEGDEWGLQRVFATKEEAYAYAARPGRARYEDCNIEEWGLGGDCLSRVATSPVPRHDAATCCGERQVTDVGDGWRELGRDEILQDGDEVDNGLWDWWLSFRVGLKAGTELRYRRRVTPEEQPLGAFLDEENNELREQVATLTAEVERLRLTADQRRVLHLSALLLERDERRGLVGKIRGIIRQHGGGEG
jgi:hypothetical protein